MEMAVPCLRPRNNFSQAEIVSGNEDLIAEILLRVPAQPLITFKCVSKQWLSLISSSDFCHRHTLRNPTSTISGVFLCSAPGLPKSLFELVSIGGDRHPEPPFRSLNFAGDAGGIRILQSCNGLLLCGTDCVFERFRSYYVYNPTTKRFRKLPPLVGVDESVWIVGVNLAFHPSKSPHYKVVCIRTTGEKSLYRQIDIYSSEMRCWRACGEPFKPPPGMALCKGVYWNGAVHWICRTGSTLYVDVEKEYFIMVKKCCGRRWIRIRLYRLRKWIRLYRVSRGHFHLIPFKRPGLQFNVYEMKRDQSRWFVQYKVDLDGIAAAFPAMIRNILDPRDSKFYAFDILSVVREENEDESSLLLQIPGNVLSYKFKDKSFKKVYELEPNYVETNGSCGRISAYHYIKTLACV